MDPGAHESQVRFKTIHSIPKLSRNCQNLRKFWLNVLAALGGQETREKHAARLVRALMRLRQQEIRHDINFDGCLRFAGRGVRPTIPKLASLKSALARSLFSQAIRICAT